MKATSKSSIGTSFHGTIGGRSESVTQQAREEITNAIAQQQ